MHELELIVRSWREAYNLAAPKAAYKESWPLFGNLQDISMEWIGDSFSSIPIGYPMKAINLMLTCWLERRPLSYTPLGIIKIATVDLFSLRDEYNTVDTPINCRVGGHELSEMSFGGS